MSKRMTPEEVLSSVVEGINTGNMDSLMTLYEAGACFATQPGQLAKDPESIRQCLHNFIHLEDNLDLKVKRGSSSKRSCFPYLRNGHLVALDLIIKAHLCF